MAKATKQSIVNSLIKDIEQGKGRGDIIAKYCKKFQKSARTVDTYWKIANQQQADRQEAIKKELELVDTAAAVDARKSGLKSKLDKQLSIQFQIEAIEKELEQGYWDDIKIVRSKEKTVKKILNPTDKAYLRKTMRDLFAELNKMEGDYAPTKVAQTTKDGEDVPTQPAIIKVYTSGPALLASEDEIK